MSMNVPDGILTAEKIASGQVVKSINSMKDNVNILAGSNVTITPSGNNLTISTTGSGSLTLPFEGEVTTPNTKGITVIHSATTGTNTGLYGQLNSTLGSAVTGIVNSTTGATRGIFGENHSSTGYGVYGTATNTSGINYGVFGRSYSSEGTGVYGFASNSSSTETYGVYGESNSSLGQGVRGLSPYIGVYGRGEGTTGLNYGLYGRSQSVDGYGVYGTSAYIGLYGRSSGASANACGVFGVSNSIYGNGVYGEAPYAGTFGLANSTSGPNYGAYGSTLSYEGYGVFGKGPSCGVYGFAYGNNNNRYGIYGIATGTGGLEWAGYFAGAVGATGFVDYSAAFFKIDNPLDPKNKWLYHSAVQSSDMKNIYDGNIITDMTGNATVLLPEWFEALNKDFRYQLTVIGDFAQVIVSREIQNNQFQIRSDKPNVKVSWQVTGIRKDAYAEKNQMIVEQNKTGDEIGKYQHPEAYGLSEEFSIDAHRNKKLQEEQSKTNIPKGEIK